MKKQIKNSRKKFSVSEKQYLSAQKKAYKIWKELLEKQPKWTFDNCLDKGNYVALAERPKRRFYTVCEMPATINTATGMFRFPNTEISDKFIKKMGKSLKYLFPEIIIK
jgi:hypothetical protein